MRTGYWIALACGALLGPNLPSTLGAVRAFPEDAPLRALQFVDDKEGWAVGDDGMILHSIDGGRTWERQFSGTRASLRGIHFRNPYSGWIVGRIELRDGGSAGIVLTTADAGLTWKQINDDNIPGLNYAQFFDESNGVACGDGSALFPTGVFLTNDCGKSWRAVPGKRCGSWRAGDFTDMQTGALAGTWGQLATLRDGYFGPADVDPLGNRSILGLKVVKSRAVAVGQGGLILTSAKSAGMKWGFAELALSRETLANIDFHAVTVVGDHIWAVGRPGSVVFHSPNFGQTWEVQKTGQPLPLHTVQFINEKEGWAAGELGTILTTSDGGKLWKVCRQGGQRAAVLFVHARSGNLPLETIAWLGGEQGYLTVGLRVTSTDLTLPKAKDASDAERMGNLLRSTKANEATDPERLVSAMRMVGGASGESMWQFPLPAYQKESAPEELLGHWDRLHGERSTVALLRQLVLAIRIWQPEMIVTDGVEGQSAEKIVVEAVKEAFKLAADPKAYPEQLETLKLSPWSAKKVCVGLNKADVTGIKFDARITGSRLGDCAKDVAAPALHIIDPDREVSEARWFRVLVARMNDAAAQTELMQGIFLAEGGQARRKLPPLTEIEHQLQHQREKALQQQKLLESLIRGEGGELAKPEQLLEQLGTLGKEMPPDVAARAALLVANEYARNGQWPLAREAFVHLIEKFPTDPLAIEGYRWLVRYHSSSEARHRHVQGQFAGCTISEVEIVDPKTQEGPIKHGTGVIQTTFGAQIDLSALAKKWFETSLSMESRLAAHGSLFVKDPAMQLCFQSARRQLGNVEAPNRWYTKYLLDTAVPNGGPPLTKGADPWRDCVASEVWLANRTIGIQPPKPLGQCLRAAAKPYLDGKLDDACWEGARSFPLRTLTGSVGQEYAAQAFFLHDSTHLYIAIHCRRPPGSNVTQVKKRKRDDDLRGHDRISILIDLDRDYQTYYQLQVDERGCVCDDCWGDIRWDPTWYAAVQNNETDWTVELAIPLAELSSDKPTSGKTWAVNVVRTIPGKAVQAWSGPADINPRPEGMGLLQFSDKLPSKEK